MLKFLNITNLAVITRLSVELHEGLNLLTGETGAGKSIIVDAMNLLLGGRTSAEIIRTGERAASVEGLFELKGESELHVRDLLAGIGIETGEEDLVIRREVQAGGRGRVFINDKTVTASTLKMLQPYLVEIHGQGEQQTLAAARSQLELLDGFAGCEELRREVSRAYSVWKAAVEAWRSLERDEAARERAGDMLRFQIAEIERAAPQPGEYEELLSERTLLSHAERALELSSGAYNDLYESDQSALTQLAMARRRLQELSEIDARVAQSLESLETASVMLADVAEGLRDYGAGFDFSPSRLAEVEDRLAELDRLQRKYGCDLRGLLEVKRSLSEQLERLSNMAHHEEELLAQIRKAERAYTPLAERLSLERRKAAPQMEKRVMEELRHVAMERAQFVVSIETAKSSSTDGAYLARQSTEQEGDVTGTSVSFWSPFGADRVEFLLTANVGESARPLARVASGGELSRLMLALRTVCRDAGVQEGARAAGATLVFDEIDTGIGGRTAEAVGRRLKALATGGQVLCVTHQAQIARFADHHYVVSKEVEEGRTITSIRELQADERVGELARMIGGAEDVETARQTARWMIESAELAAVSGAKSVKSESPRRKGKSVRK